MGSEGVEPTTLRCKRSVMPFHQPPVSLILLQIAEQSLNIPHGVQGLAHAQQQGPHPFATRRTASISAKHSATSCSSRPPRLCNCSSRAAAPVSRHCPPPAAPRSPCADRAFPPETPEPSLSILPRTVRRAGSGDTRPGERDRVESRTLRSAPRSTPRWSVARRLRRGYENPDAAAGCGQVESLHFRGDPGRSASAGRAAGSG